jgi:hypothetical protein
MIEQKESAETRIQKDGVFIAFSVKFCIKTQKRGEVGGKVESFGTVSRFEPIFSNIHFAYFWNII